MEAGSTPYPLQGEEGSPLHPYLHPCTPHPAPLHPAPLHPYTPRPLQLKHHAIHYLNTSNDPRRRRYPPPHRLPQAAHALFAGSDGVRTIGNDPALFSEFCLINNFRYSLSM